MKINNKPLGMFHMRINSFTYQPLRAERKVFQSEQSLKPILGRLDMLSKDMQLIAEFRNKLDISNFIAELLMHKENILDIDDGYRYRSFLTSLSNPQSEVWQGCYRITHPLSVIQEGSRREFHLKKDTNYIQVAGNWRTDCLFEITPNQDIEVFEIYGYEISHLYAGKTVYLDGESKRVYTATEPNKYNDCVLKDKMFPSLEPGIQEIQMNSASDVTVILKYTPIYV